MSKFIRIAWKLYRHNNFSTLTAIIAGLQSQWVQAAMKRHWSRMGIWEMRVFNDLQKFTGRNDNFRFIREATALLADASNAQGGMPPTSSSSSVAGPKSEQDRRSSPVGCVPFLGVYLSELSDCAALPDYIDPTSPGELVRFDELTGSFKGLHRPNVFSDLPRLPAPMVVEPLVNVHKQRLIAGAVKSLVAGQHLANNCFFHVERKLYQKCLKLRSLDNDSLWQVIHSES